MQASSELQLFTEVWIPSTASLVDNFCRFIEGWTCVGDTGLWGYDAVSTGKWFLPFSRKVVPPSARVKSSQNMPRRKRHFVPFKQQLPPIDKVLHPRQLIPQKCHRKLQTPHHTCFMFTHNVQGTPNTNFDSNVPTAFHIRHWK